jgi:hypothetical protein
MNNDGCARCELIKNVLFALEINHNKEIKSEILRSAFEQIESEAYGDGYIDALKGQITQMIDLVEDLEDECDCEDCENSKN